MKVGILDSLVEEDVEAEVLGPDAEVCSFACAAEEDLSDNLGSLDAVIVRSGVKITAKTIERLRSCRVLVRGGVGYDNLDIETAGRLGIPVLNVPDYGTNEVADHSFALLLALWRKVSVQNELVRADPVRGWRYDMAGPVRRLTGAALGVVGFGRIGTAVAMRAKAFGMRVVFYDPYLSDGYDKALQIERADTLDALAGQSDAVSIHAPLTAETRHLFDRRLLDAAKPGLTLVNGGRGGVVSLDAVFDGLCSGQLEAFGADVLELEPPDPKHPLIAGYAAREPWLEGRVLLTPHSAFYSVEGLRELRIKAAEQVVRALRGEPLRNCINKASLHEPRTPVI